MPYSTTAVFVKQGDTLRFKHVASAAYDKTDVVDIKIGKTGVTWLLKTITEDQSPDPFSFIDITNAELSTTYTYADGSRTTERIVTVSGLSAGTEVGVSLSVNIVNATVADYALEINGNGSWFLPGTSTRVKNGDTIKIRVKTSSFNGVNTTATLSLGNRAARWTIQTKLRLRNIPNPFPSFGNLTRQPLDTYIYSNVVQILGLSSSPASTQVLGSDSFVGISSSNATTTDANGFAVLSGATFASNTASITNGQYMQLKARSGTNLGSIKSFGFLVGEGSTANGDGSEWQVSTPTQTSPNAINFSFVNKFDQVVNSLIESAPAPAITVSNPAGGISGLGAGVSASVTLVSTTSSEVKIKINDGSIGIFPANVKNGDFITLYAKSSSSVATDVEVIINVGGTTLNAWRIGTIAGPDSTPDPLNAPPNLTNVVPDTYQTSAPVFITGINVQVPITASNGALISIDYDNPGASSRQFDPATNTSFRIILKSSAALNTLASTSVTVGTTATFTWGVTTYQTVPIGKIYRSAWYSKKNEQRSGATVAPAKYDGYSIGTIIPVLKETSGANPYGTNLTGGRDSRFPGFIYCYGQTLLVKDYLELFLTIGNTYGGTGNYTVATASATGDFKLPNYRNRRMCGTGVVDGNNSSSVFLSVTGGVGGSGTYNTVGQEGGYWYVDKVGTPGSSPEEQATGPTTSNFFTLGTVKTTGANLVTTDDVEFIVTSGALSATVGPILPASVIAPEHDHYYISAVTESDGDEPYVKWDQTALFYSPVNDLANALIYTTPSGGNAESDKIASSLITNVTNMRALFKIWLTTRGLGVGSGLDNNLQNQTGNFNSVEKIINDLSSIGTKLYLYANYWPSPTSSLAGAPLLRSIGGVNCAGVIDTVEDSFNVENFQTTDGTSTAQHSHFLSPTRIIDPTTNFSYDNVSGAGGPGALRVGLLGGSPSGVESTLQITFNTSDVQMSLNEGTFKLNTTTKIPKPSYIIEPQSTVPVITEFHKVRYMIKAY